MDPMSRQGLERLTSVLAERLGPHCEGGDEGVCTCVDPLRRQVRRSITGIDAYLVSLEAGGRTVAGLRERALDLWRYLERIASARPERDAAGGGAGSLVPPSFQSDESTVLCCLTSETVRVGDALVCCFTGDMTLDSEPFAARVLGAALGRRPVVLAVDLAGVELFTSTGLNLLLDARRRALVEGVRLVLIAPSTRTRRVLELTETAELFPVHATVEDALRYCPPPAAHPVPR
ncbi:STAS domain-containing protein [Kitasatospora sp. NPDC057965]|uniref:STAS domain-containing protein n=1 Tax=Kitasatospora sp. NPDC057965 TaxID=3346291 RepID=UPI0036DB7DCE